MTQHSPGAIGLAEQWGKLRDKWLMEHLLRANGLPHDAEFLEKIKRGAESCTLSSQRTMRSSGRIAGWRGAGSRRGWSQSSINCTAASRYCGARCEYRSVVLLDAWPASFWTVRSGTPAITSWLQKV